MNYYIFFDKHGNSKKLGVSGVMTHHRQPFLMGPKAPSYEDYPIIEFETENINGEKQKYLLACEVEPTEEVIIDAILNLKLPPVPENDMEED